jgi:predicted ribosome quality control (RQC) complex YloA/Tae2 family protein
MSIRWDALLARHTARELGHALAGARLRALRLDGDTRDLTLLFNDRSLLWRLHPRRGYLMLRDAPEPAAGDVSLRSTVIDVTAPPDERVIRFALSPSKAGRPLVLVVELMGNQWNALVVEGEGEAAIVRHVLWRRDAGRSQSVGARYHAPPPAARMGVDGRLTREAWLELLGSLPPEQRAARLVRRVAWTSPLNAPALLGSAHDPVDLDAGWEQWLRVADDRASADPVVVELPSGLQPYPFPLAGTPQHSVESLLAAFEECAGADGSMGEMAPSAEVGALLAGRLQTATVHARRRTGRLERELASLADPAALRRVGDLILARYREIPPGASGVRLVDFDGAEVAVELDPSRPPHDNASAYYQKAAKAERAAEQLPDLLGAARARVGRLEEILARARSGGASAEEILAALGPAAPPGAPAESGPSLPYRVFRSSGGLEIRVGRGARHNDALTFHHSSPADVWLHARDSAGAHVILRWQGPGNPPARDLREAATLAALHSKARTSGSAPVDWTLRKYVRKPRKAPPGQVTVERVATLFVEPDPQLLKALAVAPD